jgi:hypothetical protein
LLVSFFSLPRAGVFPVAKRADLLLKQPNCRQNRTSWFKQHRKLNPIRPPYQLKLRSNLLSRRSPQQLPVSIILLLNPSQVKQNIPFP